MPTTTKMYVAAVIATGAAVLAAAGTNWTNSDPKEFLLYLALAVLASVLKLRLPGVEGTYSLNFLFILAGIVHFTLPETLLTGCAAGLAQTLWNVKKRPTFVQTCFNVANLVISIAVCFAVVAGPMSSLVGQYPPATLALAACLYFIVNTVLVSGVLSLLQGKPLRETCREWYWWSFPYYLIGAALVGLLPAGGDTLRVESWLLIIPLLYLLHFYYGLSGDLRPRLTEDNVKKQPALPPAAMLYTTLIIAAAAVVCAGAFFQMELESGARFATYMAIGALASLCKVKMPRLTETISLNFVVLLAAAAELSLAEVVMIAGASGLVQSLWKPKVPPKPIQVVFSMSALALSSALAYGVCHFGPSSHSAAALLVTLFAATAALYFSNTVLVSAVVCLAEGKPLGDIWQACYFWSFPYYMVGAGFAGLMVSTSRAANWQVSFAVLPLMALVYISYKLRLTATATES